MCLYNIGPQKCGMARHRTAALDRMGLKAWAAGAHLIANTLACSELLGATHIECTNSALVDRILYFSRVLIGF